MFSYLFVVGQLWPRETHRLGRLSLLSFFKYLTSEIWQANLSAPLRDTAGEKNISPDLGVSDANTF